ncbi:MAG: hypothetical protein PWQ17_1057 [Anaerophaga sp.]|nr:hypothetical protein [Anaerophaga sp.]
MKKKILYSLIVLGGIIGATTSCETYDLVDEIAQTGHIAPNVYMEVPTGNVTAGDSADFSVQYWSVDRSFTDLSLWYALDVNFKFELTSVYNQEYSFVLDSAERVRDFYKVLTYEHSQSYYDTEKKAYEINGKIPVSYTLSSNEINYPDSYDQELIESLIPASVFARFYEGLFETLEYETLKEILVVDFAILDQETFDSYFIITVIEPEEEEGEPEYIYEMKEETATELLSYLKQVPVSDLIFNEAVPEYGIKYSKGYKITSKFRVINGEGIENYSEEKIITVL